MPTTINYESKGQIKEIIENITPIALKLKESISILLIDKAKIQSQTHENNLKEYLNGILNKIKPYIGMDADYNDFSFLIHIYVQSLIYGLFISWIRHRNHDYYQNFKNLNNTNIPCLKIFPTIFEDFDVKFRASHLGSLTNSIETFITEISITSKSEIQQILLTFYSEFLQHYDSQTKKDLGVIYTPDPIVQFMIKSIDFFLTQKFSLPSGIADEHVIYIDPAAGTMAFLSTLLSNIYEKNKPSSHNFSIGQFYAFEIMFIPFLVGYYVILNRLEECGIHNHELQKFNFFLKNALGNQSLLPCTSDKPIVILGNPPYNVSSNNKIEWIAEKIEDYKKEAQKFDVNVKKITSFKALQNDYIKFIRFAQWILYKQNHNGIIAFITPNTYFNDIATRGMRYSLLCDFDEIWIVDLHGDLRRKKKNQIDENVFDIRQGVGITFFIKHSSTGKKSNCILRYTEVFGTKEQKFDFLSRSIDDISFQQLQPTPQNDYLFVPDNFMHRNRYMQFPSFAEIFLKNIQGVVTGHDSLVIHSDKTILQDIILKFFNGDFEKDEIIDNKSNKRYFTKHGITYHDARDWTISFARTENYDQAVKQIIPILWRGFDRRWICYSQYLINRGTDRFPLMQYMLPHQNNLGIICTRHSFRNKENYSSCFISDTIVSDGAIEGVIASYIFPLKINNNKESDKFDKPKIPIHSNINSELKQKYPLLKDVNDDDIFYYIYAILYTPLYRSTYNQGLREDFPRIPFPDNLDIFYEMKAIGKELTEIHLLKSLNSTKDWPISENTTPFIRNPYYDPNAQKIYFSNYKEEDSSTLFWIGNISEDIWNFEIGGIKQLQSWLSGRIYKKENYKNCLHRALNRSEIEDFLRICSAIKKTIEISHKLDEIFKKIDK